MTQELNEVDEIRKGTISRIGRYVRGDCEVTNCPSKNVLVYDTYYDETLMCTEHSRRRGHEHQIHYTETCDKPDCNAGNAWRDPLSGKNEFFCATHHAQAGTVVQNRWAPAATGRIIGMREKLECEAANHGTECRGEKKWRTVHGKGMTLCNKHAGKQSSGPEWHQ